ncbi:hypothetical protein [Bryocella elongata]|nr:hypothetical protein [Bryocella elongata]
MLLLSALVLAAQQGPSAAVMTPAEVGAAMPAVVYFSGQSSTVQLRNAAGVRWEANRQTLFALVDTGGYSSGLRDRYQFYLLTDVPIVVAGKNLGPGAYGGGFLEGPGLVVMDLGGNEIFHAPYERDSDMKRPRPLQVEAGPVSGNFRLCLGRNCVALRRER